MKTETKTKVSKLVGGCLGICLLSVAVFVYLHIEKPSISQPIEPTDTTKTNGYIDLFFWGEINGWRYKGWNQTAISVRKEGECIVFKKVSMRGEDHVTLWREFRPSQNFSIKYEVKSLKLGGFACQIKISLSFGSTQCINIEFNTIGHYLYRYVKHWTGNQVIEPELNIWYQVEISVQKEPFQITLSVYREQEYMGSTSASDMRNFQFNQIEFITLQCWGGSNEYWLKNIEISG